ncbi:uncharacterized protein LOC106878805 isoform X1 [Octopus bimaculoides]|uniref:uncharacterized protein LOC106878805 isoform X1 n=1 Tax=Octopus bimaculoides TaxID=37653 RepID=UPI0022DFE04F|nr:uncharacterized protein LOC106878805 isoform X1 [Octopus bimaculoides]
MPYSVVRGFLILLSCSFVTIFSKATICYDCTSWNPYCASSVDSPFPEAVATVECNVTKTCFIRKEKDGMISRGCADWWMFSSIVSDYLGCQEQVPAWMKPQEWCFCDTDLCNGQSMADVKKLNGEIHEFNQDAENPVEMVSDEEEMESEEVDAMEQHVPHSSSSVTTILPWWWWYVHWSTERPYWMDGKAKHSSNNNNNNNNNRNNKQKINGIRGIRTKEFEDSPVKSPKTTQKEGWENSKTTKHSGHWEAAAVPTGASAADKVQKVKPKNIKQVDKIAGGNNLEASKNEIEESLSDFFCWDCYDDNPLCGEVVQTPVSYYVGRVACPITQKCFIRKDNGGNNNHYYRLFLLTTI